MKFLNKKYMEYETTAKLGNNNFFADMVLPLFVRDMRVAGQDHHWLEYNKRPISWMQMNSFIAKVAIEREREDIQIVWFSGCNVQTPVQVELLHSLRYGYKSGSK